MNQMSRTVKPRRPADTTTTRLAEEVESTDLGALGEVRRGSLLVPLAGLKVALEVQARRGFRPPSGFGPTKSDGIEVFKFRDPLGPVGAKFLAVMKEKSNRHVILEGVDVGVFEELIERTPWTFFVTYVEPDLVLCATDRGSLVQTLHRKAVRKSARAFPPSLAEWKYIDTNASLWAIRHLLADSPSPRLREGPNSKATIPEVRAIGFGFYCELHKQKVDAALVCVFASDDPSDSVRSLGSRLSPRFEPSLKRLDASSIELKFAIEKSETQSLIDFFSGVYALLGHDVYL